MGKLTTKEILTAYYESIGNLSTKSNIDKPELYAYEKKIGKEFIDMDVDDLFGLLEELRNTRKGKEIKYLVSHSSLDNLFALFRAIFNWYIDNVEVIRNPLNDKRMKGMKAVARIAQDKEVLTWEVIQDIIKKLHKDRDTDNADYIELIILLYYNGFARAEEIIALKENMINHSNRVININGKILYLSERCHSLLVKFHNMYEIEGTRGRYILLSYHDSYFKFISRQSQEGKINDRPLTSMCDIINRYLAIYVNDKYNVKINYHGLYFLGFYDYLIRKYGEERTKHILTSFRDADDIEDLMNSANEYGVEVDNVSHLKRYLRPFFNPD